MSSERETIKLQLKTIAQDKRDEISSISFHQTQKQLIFRDSPKLSRLHFRNGRQSDSR
jgi:hypothetical protein